MRIDQIIPTIVDRDAVSGHTFEVQRVLRRLGAESEIFASGIGASVRGRVRPLRNIDAYDSAPRWLLYQASIGGSAADVFAAHPSPKLVNYHNITPPELFGSFGPSSLAADTRRGRSQIRQLAPLVRLGIADSRYNEADLIEAGYRSTTVVPPLVDMTGNAEPDLKVRNRLDEERERGNSRWLFVGQVAPHKGQHALIEALAFECAAYDSHACLHIVGRETSPDYASGLRRLASALGLERAVHFEGQVSDRELAAFYEGADVFVCCSDHEGFCAPLIEAMHHRLPVVAFGAAAVPETIGRAGIVLPARTPSLVATAVARVLSDEPLRHSLVDAGVRRALDFDLERNRESFARAIEAVVGAA